MKLPNWLVKAINPDKYHENLLNKIVYSQYMNNNMAIWYDAGKRSEYITKGYQGNLMVYSIIKKITEKIKAADTYVYQDKPGRKNKSFRFREMKYSGNDVQHAISGSMRRKELEFVDGTPLNDLIENPNPWQTWDDFVESVAMFYYLTGEAFIYGVGPGEDSPNFGKFTELHVMPSHLVQIVTSGDWRDPIKGYKMIIGDQSIIIPKDAVYHYKMANPNWDLGGNQLRGQSPLMAGFKYLTKNDSALEAWVKANQNEGAKGIISPNVQDPKLWLNPSQRQSLDDRVDERINGGDNRNRVVTSSMPLRYDEIGMSPVALEILKGMQYDDEKLCALWGISPLLFTPNATFANLLEAKKSLVTDVVIPFYNMLEKGLNEFVVKPYNADGKKYVIDADTSIYPELKPDLKLMKEVYGNAWQITGNEYREMVGFDEGEDEVLNTHLLPAGLITSDDLLMGGGDPVSDSKDFDYIDYGIKAKTDGDLKGCLMYYPEFSSWDWGKALKLLIPQDIVIEYEFDPHVTILYGLLDDKLDKQAITRFIIQFMKDKKIDLKAKSLGVFSNEEYDVIKINIEDDNGVLTELNKALRSRFPYENKFTDYSPHITLAYVDKGTGSRFEGQSIDKDSFGLYSLNQGKIVYSDSDKKHTRVL